MASKRKAPASGKENKPQGETSEARIERLENELSSQKAVVQQLTNMLRDLQESSKEYKDRAEKAEVKIQQLEKELEKEKEKNNWNKSESSNSPPLVKK